MALSLLHRRPPAVLGGLGAALAVTGALLSWPLVTRAGTGADLTVGALYGVDAGTGQRLEQHHCTASVVHSRSGNTLVTAAHCALSDQPLYFVPGLRPGRRPLGSWPVVDRVLSEDWDESRDPDLDVAFLKVGPDRPGGPPIEQVTGANVFRAGTDFGQPVQLTGYPIGSDQPVTCQTETGRQSARQYRLDSPDFTDGTSGGPLVVRGGASGSGPDEVIGVIGGYQEGGDSPDVSYAARFGDEVAELYGRAVRLG